MLKICYMNLKIFKMFSKEIKINGFKKVLLFLKVIKNIGKFP